MMGRTVLVTCGKCGSTHPAEGAVCPVCADRRARNAEAARAYRARRGADYLAHDREYRAGRRDDVNEARRQRYAADPSAPRAHRKASYQRNKPSAQAYAKRYRWTAIGRLKNMAAGYRRRCRAFGFEPLDTLTAEQWTAALAVHAGKCHYCKEAEATTGDHDLPVSRGGAHTAENVVPACLRCNQQKGERTAAEWAADEARNTRICRACGDESPKSNFQKDKGTCNKCLNERRRGRNAESRAVA